MQTNVDSPVINVAENTSRSKLCSLTQSVNCAKQKWQRDCVIHKKWQLICRNTSNKSALMLLSGAASNVIHPEPRRARRDALMSPEHTSSPMYRRAAVTSSPRNLPTQPPSPHPRVAELRRQESGSSHGSRASNSPLLGASDAAGSPGSSQDPTARMQLPMSFAKRQLYRRGSR